MCEGEQLAGGELRPQFLGAGADVVSLSLTAVGALSCEKKLDEDRLHHASREADSSSAPIADAKISQSGRSHMINTG